jgi:hypothetical protein
VCLYMCVCLCVHVCACLCVRGVCHSNQHDPDFDRANSRCHARGCPLSPPPSPSPSAGAMSLTLSMSASSRPLARLAGGFLACAADCAAGENTRRRGLDTALSSYFLRRLFLEEEDDAEDDEDE